MLIVEHRAFLPGNMPQLDGVSAPRRRCRTYRSQPLLNATGLAFINATLGTKAPGFMHVGLSRRSGEVAFAWVRVCLMPLFNLCARLV